MAAIEFGLSLMVEDAFAAAVLPLLESGIVDALEYSFEIGWHDAGLPGWASELLDHYGAAGRLWGHGVTMSPFSIDGDAHHDRWLRAVQRACERWTFRGVSEHYGFMREGDVHGGAPLPPPPCDAAIATGRAALDRLAQATGLAVGLENLALALGPGDLWFQGPALASMLDTTDGYLVLDLHNLYCQAHNFGVDARALLATYPLSRVRCLHVSGGSWSSHRVEGHERSFRRDTHDAATPPDVFALLAEAAPRCPNLQTVILERLGPTIRTPDDAEALRHDARTVVSTLRTLPRHGETDPLPTPDTAAPLSVDADTVRHYQTQLLTQLRAGVPPVEISQSLADDSRLSPLRAHIGSLDAHALAVATAIIGRWQDRPAALGPG